MEEHAQRVELYAIWYRTILWMAGNDRDSTEFLW